MTETAYHRLELWFMRDLTDLERADLFKLFGVFGLQTLAEQQKAFRKIIDQHAETAARRP